MIQTACFFTYSGPGRVSIARSAPRTIKPGYRVYRALAPGNWFKSVAWPEYERRYANQLSELDPAQVVKDLYLLAGGHEPVLLCWERIDLGQRCHRQLVAAWLNKELRLDVREALLAR